jgi:hypothetical protein
MKVKINIREAIAENADHETLMLAPVGIDIDELFDFNGIDDEHEIDLYDLLDQQRMIGQFWGIDDVKSVRPHLTDDQAWEVLQTVERRLDANFGINWDVIRDTADELHPEPEPVLPPDPEQMNDKRSAWAGAAVAAFQQATGTDDEDALGDLLCDLMHWADRANYDFQAALTRANDHYAAETAGEGI